MTANGPAAFCKPWLLLPHGIDLPGNTTSPAVQLRKMQQRLLCRPAQTLAAGPVPRLSVAPAQAAPAAMPADRAARAEAAVQSQDLPVSSNNSSSWGASEGLVGAVLSELQEGW